MELVNMSEKLHPCKIGKWNVYQGTGEGSTSRAFIVIHEETKEIACLKIFRSKQFSELAFSEELKIHKNLDHPRIVKLKDSLQNWDHTEPSGEQMKINALVMEYMRGGELFELLEAIGPMPEVLARTYFHQLLSGVEYLHKNGICHRDLKPENLLLDEKLNLKIADFGCACKSERGKKLEPVGTTRYQLPEALAGLEIDAQEADLFACGIILFVMASGHFPFESAKQNDYTYYLLNGDKNANELFWNSHEKITCQSLADTGRPIFSEDFRDLINRVLSVDSEERPTLTKIKEHPWMKGPILEDDLIMGYIKGN